MTTPSYLPSTKDESFHASPSPELVEEVGGMSTAQHDALREECKHNLFFLNYGILGYTDMTEELHGEMCQFIVHCELMRRLVTVSRGALKSSVCTVGDSVRLALLDPHGTRILIRSEGEENSIGWLSEIKGHFQNNELIQTLFPELIPDRFTGPGVVWSQTKASINRDSNYKEPTWTAAGIKTGIVSRHFTRIKYDDIIGQEAKASNAAMVYANNVCRETESLLVSVDDNIIDFIGTRKGRNDTYQFLKNFYGPELAIFHRLPIRNGHSIYPKGFSVKFLRRLREYDPVTYFSEYANDPIEDGSKDFKTDAIKYYAIGDNGDIVYRDEKSGTLKRWDRDALDIVMACDPNSGQLSAPDFPAIAVIAVSPLDQYFVLDIWAKKVGADAFVDQIFDMFRFWQPRAVGIEQAGQQTTAEYFDLKTRRENTYVPIIQLRHKNVPNDVRIRRKLQPIINRGRFYLLKAQDDIYNQIQFHPDVENDDILTAVSYAVSMANAPEESDLDSDLEREKVRDDAIAKVTALRAQQGMNPNTGY